MKVTRPTRVCERILFVDGMSGSGKSLLGPILGSLKNVELYRLEHTYEYLSCLDALGVIDPDSAEASNFSPCRSGCNLGKYSFQSARSGGGAEKGLSRGDGAGEGRIRLAGGAGQRPDTVRR